MGDEEEEHVEGPPSWFWRWLLGVALLCGGAPILITALIYVGVAGFTFRSEFGMAIPFIFGGLALLVGAPAGLFAITYLLLRERSRRRTLYLIGAMTGASGPALLSLKEEIELLEFLLLLPVFMMLGAGASALFVWVVDGRASRRTRLETTETTM